MEIIFHIGLHCTEEDRLRNTLLKNRGILLEQGILVPPPSRFRNHIRHAVSRLKNKDSPKILWLQNKTLSDILQNDAPERLVLCSKEFMGGPRDTHGNNQLYPAAGENVKLLRDLFPNHAVEFHFSLRNLATFFPAVFQSSKLESFKEFMGRCDLRKFSWADMVRRMRASVPDAPFVIWANEDTPLIWPEILETITRHAPHTHMIGREDILQEVMKPAGFERLTNYLKKRPPQGITTYARVAATFLEKYLDETKLQEELDLPGWTNKVVDHLTATYDEDIAQVTKIPGVDWIDVSI